MSVTDKSTIRAGRRVICRKQGPYNGARGKVIETLCGDEVAKVHFDVEDGGSTIIEQAEYFEPVLEESYQ